MSGVETPERCGVCEFEKDSRGRCGCPLTLSQIWQHSATRHDFTPPARAEKKVDPEVQRAVEALTDWWMDRAAAEVAAVAPKAVEYGSLDLAEVGRTMSAVTGKDPGDHAEATELGIYFYLIGKMARWTEAIRLGKRVSDDTLLDLGIYIKMAQRVRDVGGWPYVEEDH